VPGRSAVPIYLYSMNARSRDGIVPYQLLFDEVARRESSQTIQEISRDLTFAIDLDEMSSKENPPAAGAQRFFAGQVIAGSPGDVPLYFDYTTGETEEGATPEGKWLAQVSGMVVSVSPEIRYLALEGGRHGVTVPRLSRYFTLLTQTVLGIENVEFDITPVQSESLRAEIESFERIKEATAIVSRPNLDWSDMNDKLSTLAEESFGHEAEATVRAARSESLSKTHGIISTILSSLGNPSPAVRKFKVTGRKVNSDRDTVITSEKHQERVFARVPRSASAGDLARNVYDRGRSLIEGKLSSASGSNNAQPQGVEASESGQTHG
jgi:hypothetical protein